MLARLLGLLGPVTPSGSPNPPVCTFSTGVGFVIVGVAELPLVISPVLHGPRGCAGWAVSTLRFSGWNVSFTLGSSASTWRGFGLGASIFGAKNFAMFGLGGVCPPGGGGGCTFAILGGAGGFGGLGGAGTSSGGPAISVTMYIMCGTICCGNSRGRVTTNATRQI